jgi:SAM-dependent methyltransferase
MKKEFIFEFDYNRILLPESQQALTGRKGTVLNIACEYTLIPDFLKGIVSPENVYGLEINKEIVKNNPQVRYCDVDHDAIPFDNDSLDLILSIWGFEHFQTDNIFKESSRVLNAGGRLIMLTPNIVNPLFLANKLSKGWASEIYFKYLTKSQYKPHETHYNFNKAATIERAARKHGLTLEKTIYFGPSFYTKYFEFNKILESLVIKTDKLITNPVFGYLKPYIICVIKK